MEKHSAIMLSFGWDLPPLNICSFAVSNVTLPTLFSHLSKDCHPKATKSQKYVHDDKDFTDSEIKRLLAENIIEPSNSPWQAEVITANENSNKRLCIDCSQTINRFTHLDVQLLPRIDNQVNEIANFKIFSSLIWKVHIIRYHCLPRIRLIYIAFEASGKLYQFTHMPFGLKNAAAAFQQKMDNFIAETNFKNTWPYLDHLSTAGNTQE